MNRAPLRVLAVRADLHERVYEAAEMWQVIGGLVGLPDDDVAVRVTDSHRIAEALAGPSTTEAVGWRRLHWRRPGVDVVHVFGAIPAPVRVLLLALTCRLRGIPVVFTPMSLLSEDFARASWYRGRVGVQRHVRALLVRVLRWCWARVATVSVVSGEHERTTTPLRPSACVEMPWPLPDTPLTTVALERARSGGTEGAADGPLALVSRPDPWRKGFDRLGSWLVANAGTLPKPALAVYAPDDGPTQEELAAFEADGLIMWDRTTRGSQLADALAGCRGVVLLSRWEGQPRALREATLLGLPTLSSHEAQFAEVVAHVGAGKVLDGDDTEAVQAAFLALTERKVDVAAARDLFDPGNLATFLLDLYRDVVAGTEVDGRSYYRVRAQARMPREAT